MVPFRVSKRRNQDRHYIDRNLTLVQLKSLIKMSTGLNSAVKNPLLDGGYFVMYELKQHVVLRLD